MNNMNNIINTQSLLIDSDADDSDNSDNSDNEINNEEDIDIEKIQSETSILAQIDRKLSLKFLKEGKTSRTYISGLDSYIKNVDELNNFVKTLQKTIGTSLLKKTVDDKLVFGFGGDHIRTIYEYIIKKNICPIHEIKK